MNKLKFISIIAIYFFLTMAGCSQDQSGTDPGSPSMAQPEPHPGTGPETPPTSLTPADRSLSVATNTFAFNLFRGIYSASGPNENIFISPLSVSYAIGMARNGAKGETRDGMTQTLALAGLSDSVINQSYKNLTAYLMNLDPAVTFRIANSFWYRVGKPIQPEFIDLSRDYFDALVREIDFAAPGATDIINGWVENNTNGRIKQIVSPPLSPDIASILMNAIYFKGAWTHLFDTAETVDGSFHMSDGRTVTCRMMTMEDTISYLANDLFTAIDLPYGDGKFSMAILMPQESQWGAFMGEFTAENWEIWRGLFHQKVTEYGIPRFKFEYEKSLNEVLTAMGMGAAFYSSADFSGLFADGVGWISEVKHKAFVQVDEQGTEAAAVTIIIFVDSISKGLLFDRPFIFVIHERESGAIVFMGKIAKPVWGD